MLTVTDEMVEAGARAVCKHHFVTNPPAAWPCWICLYDTRRALTAALAEGQGRKDETANVGDMGTKNDLARPQN